MGDCGRPGLGIGILVLLLAGMIRKRSAKPAASPT
jgi:hypothetical protein